MENGVTNGVSWEEEKAIYSDLQRRQQELADAERREAYAAVSKALASYRWWKPRSLLNRFRLALAAWRFSRRLRAQKH